MINSSPQGDDVVIMEQVCGLRSAAGGPEGERYNLCLRDGRYTSQASAKDYTPRSSPGDGGGGRGGGGGGEKSL